MLKMVYGNVICGQKYNKYKAKQIINHGNKKRGVGGWRWWGFILIRCGSKQREGVPVTG